jgi:hypothetical protein
MPAVSLSTTRRSSLAITAAAGAFGLVLLAAPCRAQTVPAADLAKWTASPTSRMEAPEFDRGGDPLRPEVLRLELQGPKLNSPAACRPRNRSLPR